MSLHNLKWLKNVKDQGDEFKWAYSRFKRNDLFKLAWKDNEEDARKAEKNDLIFLKQHGYITHLVKVLDYQPEREDWNGDYNIYRIVEVLWPSPIDFDFNNPPILARAETMFDYPEVLRYQGGDIMKLQDLPTFKARWDRDGGLRGFHLHIQRLGLSGLSSDRL